MTVILYNKYVSVIGGDNIFQRDFSTCSIIQTADGVQLQWSLFDTVNLYLASITTNLYGTALTYETVTDMYNDYISKQQALSSGGGGATGWDTMLSQNQAQSQDQNINLAGNALYLNGGEIYFTDNEGNVNLWFSGSAQTTQLGNETNIFIDENAGCISLKALNNFNIIGFNGDIVYFIQGDGSIYGNNTNSQNRFFSLEDSNFRIYNSSSNNLVAALDGNGLSINNGRSCFYNGQICNDDGEYTIFYVDQDGLQTVDALGGYGTMSPSWLLGDVVDGGVDLDTTKSIAVSINGVLYNLALANGL